MKKKSVKLSIPLFIGGMFLVVAVGAGGVIFSIVSSEPEKLPISTVPDASTPNPEKTGVIATEFPTLGLTSTPEINPTSTPIQSTGQSMAPTSAPAPTSTPRPLPTSTPFPTPTRVVSKPTVTPTPRQSGGS